MHGAGNLGRTYTQGYTLGTDQTGVPAGLSLLPVTKASWTPGRPAGVDMRSHLLLSALVALVAISASPVSAAGSDPVLFYSIQSTVNAVSFSHLVLVQVFSQAHS